MFVTGRLVALVALGAIPLVLLGTLGVPALLVLALWVLICLVLVTLDVTLAPSTDALLVERTLPRRVRLGETAEVRIRMINTSTRHLRGRLRDGWQPTAGAGSARVNVNIPPAESRTVTLTLVPRRRGERRSAFVAIRMSGPFGIAGRQRVRALPGAFRVLPPFLSRRHLPSRVARLKELDGASRVQLRGPGTEFDSLREYVRGDDVRAIDWRATARAGSTMLRTWRPERDRHVVVIIDSGRTSAARIGDGTRLDAAMEACQLLAALAATAGDHVHVLAGDQELRAQVTGVDGSALLPAISNALALVEPTLAATDWDMLTRRAAELTPHPSLTVVLTTPESPEASRRMLGALPMLVARSRLTLVAAMRDPLDDPEATPESSAGRLLAVYQEAAAETAALDIDRARTAWERAGARSVTAGEVDFPVVVADRYLLFKAGGLL